MIDNEIKITEIERLALVNQFLILEKLYPEDADYYEQSRLTLEQGYKAHYKTLFKNIWIEISESQTSEVLDILEMYRSITWSCTDEKNKNVIDLKYKFKGFDENEEAEQLSYCYYFIVNLKRYQELVIGSGRPDFKSHGVMLPKYRRMLEVWKREKEPFSTKLDLSQIEKILDA